jgi:hypothetical protein
VAFGALVGALLAATWLSLPGAAGLTPDQVPESLRWVVRAILVAAAVMGVLNLVAGWSVRSTVDGWERWFGAWLDRGNADLRFWSSLSGLAAVVVVATAGAALLAGRCQPGAGRPVPPPVREFRLPAGSQPGSIRPGRDGALWFAESRTLSGTASDVMSR